MGKWRKGELRCSASSVDNRMAVRMYFNEPSFKQGVRLRPQSLSQMIPAADDPCNLDHSWVRVTIAARHYKVITWDASQMAPY